MTGPGLGRSAKIKKTGHELLDVKVGNVSSLLGVFTRLLLASLYSKLMSYTVLKEKQ
jgi:hypothetical protein